MGTGQTGGVMGCAFTWSMDCLHVGTPAASGMSRRLLLPLGHWLSQCISLLCWHMVSWWIIFRESIYVHSM